MEKLSSDDWKDLEELNRKVQAHTGPWGEVKGGQEIKPGVRQMPYMDKDPLVSEFIGVWSNKGLSYTFDWMNWDEGRAWFGSRDPSKYDQLDAETAMKLVTAAVRSDRFSEGALVAAFESGAIPGILNRFVNLPRD